MADAIDRGRESFRRRAWGDAFAQLSVAEGDSHLELEDLERLGAAAYVVGRVDDSVDAWARAHHEYMQAGEAARAARCAFWLAFVLLNKGALGGGGGWVHRAQRLLDEGQRDCVEQGYVCYCAALLLAFKGDVEAAHAGFAEATKIGDRGDLCGTRQRGGHVEVLKRDKNTPGREAGETGASGALMDMETLKQPAPTVLPNPRPGLWTVGKPASSNAGDGWVPAPGMLHLATLLGCPQPSYDR